jgi:hypothetical protein
VTSGAATSPIAVAHVPIDELRPDPANPRWIGDDELEALTRSLRRFGFVQPVLARRKDRVVIGGHQRLVAARRLGIATVPVVWLDVSVEEARLLGLALNKISGSWDEQPLARLLADLQSSGSLDDPATRGLATADSNTRKAPGSRPGPEGRVGASYSVSASPLSATGPGALPFARRGFVGTTSGVVSTGSGATSAALAAVDAFRRAVVYWFQWTLHIRPSPSFWLGWTGKSSTGASCASIPKRVEPMHMRSSAISFVLSLAVAHLTTRRTSITRLAPQCKVGA